MSPRHQDGLVPEARHRVAPNEHPVEDVQPSSREEHDHRPLQMVAPVADPPGLALRLALHGDGVALAGSARAATPPSAAHATPRPGSVAPARRAGAVAHPAPVRPPTPVPLPPRRRDTAPHRWHADPWVARDPRWPAAADASGESRASGGLLQRAASPAPAAGCCSARRRPEARHANDAGQCPPPGYCPASLARPAQGRARPVLARGRRRKRRVRRLRRAVAARGGGPRLDVPAMRGSIGGRPGQGPTGAARAADPTTVREDLGTLRGERFSNAPPGRIRAARTWRRGDGRFPPGTAKGHNWSGSVPQADTSR